MSVSDLVEKTKEAFEELLDIYRARTAKPHMNDLTEAEVEKISADLDKEADRYMERAGDLREHWAIMHGPLQRCRGCGALIKEDRTVWQELHAKTRAYYPKGSIPSEESLGLFPFGSDCNCSHVPCFAGARTPTAAPPRSLEGSAEA